tara:strand:+ start:185 stop:499 length:315 start_codon:yes stop_codon:yes gene_type:complete
MSEVFHPNHTQTTTMTVILDYPRTTDVPSEDTTYNGWTNYETWNVALWINHDICLYEIAKECENYRQFVDYIMSCGDCTTGDGVSWHDPQINRDELNEVIEEIK